MVLFTNEEIIKLLNYSISRIDEYNTNYYNFVNNYLIRIGSHDNLIHYKKIPPINTDEKKLIFCNLCNEIYNNFKNIITNNNGTYKIPINNYIISDDDDNDNNDDDNDNDDNDDNNVDITSENLFKLIIDTLLGIYINLDSRQNIKLDYAEKEDDKITHKSILTADFEHEIYKILLRIMTLYILSIDSMPSRIQQLMPNYKPPTPYYMPDYTNLDLPKPKMPGGKKTKNRKRKRMSNKSVKKSSIRKYKRKRSKSSE
jgi:hypothetical protein